MVQVQRAAHETEQVQHVRQQAMEHHMAATAAEAESNSIMNARRAADEINAVAKTPAPSRRVNGAQLSAQFQVDTDAATASGGGGGGGGGGVYRELLRMALVDGKLAAGESVQLEEARRQYGLTWEQHHQLLNELTNGTGNVHVEAPRGRVHNQIRKASSNVTMTPISTGGRVACWRHALCSAIGWLGSAFHGACWAAVAAELPAWECFRWESCV
jgi:hypothetical protein